MAKRKVGDVVEAGEEILIGPFEQCVHCEGSGVHISTQKERDLCSFCHGAGRRVREEYAWACVLLNYTSKLADAIALLTREAQETKGSVDYANEMRRLYRLKDRADKEKAQRERQLEEQLQELADTGRIKNKRL